MKRSNFVDRDSRRNALKGMAVLGGAAALSTTSTSSADSAHLETQEKSASKSWLS